MIRLALCLVMLTACECGEGPQQDHQGTTEEPSPEASNRPLSEFFPAQPGDRWRYENGPESVLRLVTVADANMAVITGDDRTAPLRFRIELDAISMVDIQGASAGRLLESPIEVGHHWSYDAGNVPCEARYAETDRVEEVAGVQLRDCVVVERRCIYPAGQPFEAQTTEAHAETYCPGVGRVHERITLDPAPGDLAGRDDRLSFYRVAGAPAPTRPELFGCDQFLLALNDIQAACGPRFRPRDVDAERGQCIVRFEADDTQLEFVAARETLNAEGSTFAGEENGFKFTARLQGSACPEERFTLLQPLVRSLLRD